MLLPRELFSPLLLIPPCVFFNRTIIADPPSERVRESPVWRRQDTDQDSQLKSWVCTYMYSYIVEPIRYKFEIQHISLKAEIGVRKTRTTYMKDDGLLGCFFGCGAAHCGIITAPKNNTTTIKKKMMMMRSSKRGRGRETERKRLERTNHRLVIASFTYCENNVILTRVGQLAPKHHHCFRNSFHRRRRRSLRWSCCCCCFASSFSPFACVLLERPEKPSPLSLLAALLAAFKSGKLYFSFSGWIIIVWRRTTR